MAGDGRRWREIAGNGGATADEPACECVGEASSRLTDKAASKRTEVVQSGGGRRRGVCVADSDDAMMRLTTASDETATAVRWRRFTGGVLKEMDGVSTVNLSTSGARWYRLLLSLTVPAVIWASPVLPLVLESLWWSGCGLNFT
ncbi:DNA mismatch repair protein MutL [Striga asiatica]|uniref:DNA mismatch repair protein MutL n=1 Tax=Striga asiatica TaxID=4170 RepID=A0A5A7QKR2_STRAF|nr:DNA mismatch repair protein MutL [Striga asiatica]